MNVFKIVSPKHIIFGCINANCLEGPWWNHWWWLSLGSVTKGLVWEAFSFSVPFPFVLFVLFILFCSPSVFIYCDGSWVLYGTCYFYGDKKFKTINLKRYKLFFKFINSETLSSTRVYLLRYFPHFMTQNSWLSLGVNLPKIPVAESGFKYIDVLQLRARMLFPLCHALSRASSFH